MINNSNHYDGFSATITITEEYDNMIHFAGVFNTRFAEIKFVACYNGAIYKSEVSESRHADSYFADIIGGDSFVFDFHIPFAESGDINFFVQEDDGGLFPAKIVYSFPSRINDLSSSFFIGSHTLITRIENTGSLHVETLEYEKLCDAVNAYINENFDGQYQEDKDVFRAFTWEIKRYLRPKKLYALHRD